MGRVRFKTALVLSGGSARALTHLGVLEEIQKHRIRPDLIVGTSMGAIIGAMYAYYSDVGPVIEKMRSVLGSDLFLRAVSIAVEDTHEVVPDSLLNRFVGLFRRGVYYTQSLIRPTLISEKTYLEIMSDLIPDCAIEALSVPFAAVAMDLATGEEVVLRKGSLLKAVSASSAIPGLLPPVNLHGRTLVDGGWADNVPVAPAVAMGAHFTLAVDATPGIQALGALHASALETVLRCNEITRILLTAQRRNPADVLLIPSLGQMNWANFAALEPCRAAGRNVLAQNLPLITRARRQRLFLSLFGHLHPARSHHWNHSFVTFD